MLIEMQSYKLDNNPLNLASYESRKFSQRQGYHGKDYRHRSGNHQLVRRGSGGRRTQSHPQRGGRAHHSLRGRLHQERRAAGGPGGQAAGHHQPGEHRLLHQALHGPALQRSQRRDEDGALQGDPAGRPRGRDGAGQGVHPAGDFGDDSAEAEGLAPKPTWARRSPRR